MEQERNFEIENNEALEQDPTVTKTEPVTQKPQKKKKNHIGVIISAVVLAIVVFFAFNTYKEFNRTTAKPGTDVTVTVERGWSAEQIGNELKEKGVIDNVFFFKLKVKQMDKTSSLSYGTYELNTGMSMYEVIQVLTDSAKSGIKLTIPEGYSVQMIAKKLDEESICTEQDFLNALDDEYDYAFLDGIDWDGVNGYKLQGFLFPDTYYFVENTPAHEVIDKMLGQFETKCKELDLIQSGYSMSEIVTVASLVEREAKIEAEREIIAGVIFNRLAVNMPLQIDASVLYGITSGLYDKNALTSADLETENAYNTYKNTGLPPTPICNPGFASLRAAAKPDRHNYYYYHTDTVNNDGSHIFSQTYDEHLATMS